MARINISQILMKRGNTTAANTYVGPLGELVVDTGLRTIRVQDGATPGGMSTLATNVQLQALGTYANATFGTSSYGNANVALHLLTSSIIGNINANVTAANATIISLTSNAATQATLIDAINANVTAANAAITSLTSNAAIQASILDTLTGNAASQSTLLDTLTSNAATQATSLSTLLSNAVTQQTSLTDLVANAAAQAQAIANAAGTYGNATVEAYIGANIGTLYSNAATQAGSISTLQTQVYANANVAEYLPTYTGNIAGNIVKNGYTWTFSNTGTTTFPTGVRLSNARGPNTVNFTTDIDKSFQIETQTSTTGRLWSFGTDGNLTLPQNANINFSNGVSILAGITGTYGNTQVAAYLPTYTGNIAGNIVKNGNVWTFGTNGTTTFPTNISIDYSGNNVQFPRIIADTGKAFSVQAQGNIGSAALSWTVDPDAAGQYAAVAVTKGGGDNLAKVLLSAQSDSGDAATAKTWVFNQTGTTQFPGSTILAPVSQSITMQSDQYSQLMWENANVTVAPNMAINSNFYVAQNNATLDIGYRDGSSTQLIKSWYWNVDGGMSFPDTTTQYTAFSNAAVATYLANYDGGINFTASPAVITGLGNISSANFTFANGVNILSTVTDLYANAAVQSANIATLFSNAATQATSINTINNTLTNTNVAIGASAGATSQGTSAVAIGEGAGTLNQGIYSVAIGNDAGTDNQGDRSVAVGTGAGRTNQGNYAVAIGRNAGYTNQGNNSIIINATTGTLNQITANTFTVAPVRNDVSNVAQILFYNTTNKEITYGNTINIAGNINAAQYNFANGVNILSTVGAGAYGNTQVASYLLHFDGDIEFTSSTARIGNVDVITVMDHIRSPAYQFSNGVSILSGLGYGNTEVASYLPTYSGNITAGNVIATRFIGNTIGTTATYTSTVTAANLLMSSRTINSTSTTVDLFNNTTLNINAFGAATDINIGVNNAAARFGIKTPNIWFDNLANLETYSSNINVFNTTATGINAFGTANTIVFGANTSSTTFRGNVTAGNLITGGALYVANITTTGAYGNITGANVISANTVSANTFRGNLLIGNTNINNVGQVFTDEVIANASLTSYGNTYTRYEVRAGGPFAYNGIFNAFATTSINPQVQILGNVGSVSAVGNITGGNIGTAGQVSATNYLFANGVNILSTVTAGTYANANVATFLAAYGSNTITTTGNITAGNLIGNISITGNVTGTSANVTLVAGSYSWKFDNTGNLTLPGNTFAVNYANTTPVNVVTRFESTWTVPTGNSTQSFTVGAGETYYMWVDCNIPNGIIAWNATATVTNTNVPVVGAQYAWVYTGNGTPIDFTSIPNQFVGTANTIVRSTTAPSGTTNQFDFGLNNTSGGNVTVRYGWIQIS